MKSSRIIPTSPLRRIRSFITGLALLAAATFASALAPATSHAQTPGSSLSASILGGLQGSNLSGSSALGTYWALRGSMGDYYAEYRQVHWGGSTTSTDESITENGYLVGYKMSLFNLVLSGGVGLGTTEHRAASLTGSASAPESYQSLAYEAQAVYNIPVVPHFITVGVGVNAAGETSANTPVLGIGGIGSLSVGF